MSKILIRPTRNNACQINDPVVITTGLLLTAVLEIPFSREIEIKAYYTACEIDFTWSLVLRSIER